MGAEDVVVSAEGVVYTGTEDGAIWAIDPATGSTRLVADTGIHWKGWTIEQARACFTDNSALAPHNIETELQRYISWPGQALAYKIGELRFRALRREAEQALGERFNVREFHDALLLSGALPLEVLSKRIKAWIAEQSAQGAGPSTATP